MINKVVIKCDEPQTNDEKYSNEQLVARIRAGENEAEYMLLFVAAESGLYS